ncbi:MAG: SDR family oxidoreductase [Acidobacteriota bacterium]
MVVGASGQLGQTVAACLADHYPVLALAHADLELTNASQVHAIVKDERPWAVLNCAGYNQVDLAEEQPELALEANTFAVLTLARAAREVGATLVHYSSDFVFGGEANEPYVEEAPADPRSLYAASKLMGEWLAAEAPAHFVLRVESLFGGLRLQKSSLDRILDLVASGQPVKAFIDRTVSPSYAWDVADATRRLLEHAPPPGVYHCVNTGAATWFEVATEARRLLRSDSSIEPITMAEVPLPAARPRYCALANEKLRAVGIAMPTWQDALSRCIAARQL